MHDFVTKFSASFAILDFFIQNKVVLGYKNTRMNKCVCFRAAGSVSSYDTKRPNEKWSEQRPKWEWGSVLWHFVGDFTPGRCAKKSKKQTDFAANTYTGILKSDNCHKKFVINVCIYYI